MQAWGATLTCAVFATLVAACGDHDVGFDAPREAVVVVSPHPDDESIMGAVTLHRLAADSNRYLHAIYVSSGDGAAKPGDCNGIPEAQKVEQVVALREAETHAAWKVIAPDRDVRIDFVRGPDQGLVASSTMIDGVRADVLTAAGQRALERTAELAAQLPPSVQSVLLLTAAIYDAHPDHRTAYHATRQAAERLRDQHLDVRIWSWIIHDEISDLNFPLCCPGDGHWPSAGAHNNYLTLTNAAARPRPPLWTRVEDVSDSMTLRHDALAQHVSQVVGYSPLCMTVFIPRFYTRWTEKEEEPFYEEVP